MFWAKAETVMMLIIREINAKNRESLTVRLEGKKMDDKAFKQSL